MDVFDFSPNLDTAAVFRSRKQSVSSSNLLFVSLTLVPFAFLATAGPSLIRIYLKGMFSTFRPNSSLANDILPTSMEH